MSMTIRRASRKSAWLKCAITGVSGAGKTYGALMLAQGLAKRPIMIDTENGSGELYSHLFEYDYIQIEPPFTPAKFVQAIEMAVANGNDLAIIDSLSHAWKYVLDYKDGLDSSHPKSSFANWRKAKKLFDETMTAILQSPINICACMREKSEYTETFDSRGTKHMQKTGTSPIAEPDLEYEFTVCFKVDRSHQAIASKDRTEIFDVATPFTLSKTTGQKLAAWMNGGSGELLRDTNWKAGMLADPEVKTYLNEAEKMEIGASKESPVATYKDVITFWNIEPDQWAEFKALVESKVPDRKSGAVILEAYQEGLRDLQDACDWVSHGCPPLVEEVTEAELDAQSDVASDSEQKPEPVAEIESKTEIAAEPASETDDVVSEQIGKYARHAAPEPKSVPEPEATADPEPVAKPEAADKKKSKSATPLDEAFGLKIVRMPLEKQFQSEATPSQYAMLTNYYSSRNVEPGEVEEFGRVLAKAYQIPLNTSAWAAICLEFLERATDDQIDSVRSEFTPGASQ